MKGEVVLGELIRFLIQNKWIMFGSFIQHSAPQTKCAIFFT
jgi:hypothetical protein